jgi:hypothetical protein
VTPHWHALQDAGTKSAAPVNAERLGLRQSSGAFKFADGLTWPGLVGKENPNELNLPMIGASHVVSYIHNEGCHGSKIGFVFEQSQFQ